MTEQEEIQFFSLVANVYSFYRRDFSDYAGGVWYSALKNFDFAAIADAVGRHSVNPDTGRFMPMPADIVQMLQGTTIDSALTAWTKVDRGVRVVGPWKSVVFDDALIHCVITEMGGWTMFANKEDKDWPFLKNEFSTRYRGYRSRSMVPEYPPVLVGMSEANNSREGILGVEPPVLIGEPAVARQVMLMGSNRPVLAITRMDARESAATLRLVDERRQAA